jgi:hypothetical protein
LLLLLLLELDIHLQLQARKLILLVAELLLYLLQLLLYCCKIRLAAADAIRQSGMLLQTLGKGTTQPRQLLFRISNLQQAHVGVSLLFRSQHTDKHPLTACDS